MNVAAGLNEILEVADKLQAERKYTEAIEYLREYEGRISAIADEKIREKVAQVRQHQMAERSRTIEAAEQARRDLTKEIDEIRALYIAATDQDLWLDSEVEDEEYKTLARYRDMLNNPKSDEYTDIVISRVQAGFEPGDDRQANFAWLRKQRTLLEDVKFRLELTELRERVAKRIRELSQTTQLYDSRSQHLQYSHLLEKYENWRRQGLQTAVPPAVQDGQVIEQTVGARVRIEEIISQLRTELANYSLNKARSALSQVIFIEGNVADVVSAWNESPPERRRLKADLSLEEIRKQIHLGLYQLDPKQYIPKYSRETYVDPVPESDPRPALFADEGLTSQALAVERALNTALELYEFASSCITSPDQYSLAKLYEAYYRYTSEEMHAKMQEKERRALQPYEDKRWEVERVSVEKLDEARRNREYQELEEFKAKLSAEPFYNSRYMPQESREKLNALIAFAEARQERLRAYQRMQDELQELRESFRKCLSPFKPAEARTLVEQLESYPEAERAFLKEGLAEELRQYRHLADEATTFAQLEAAFKAAIVAQGDGSLHNLLKSTLRRQYLDQWKGVVAAAERYSDPRAAAQSTHWHAGRFYYLFAESMRMCLEGGEKSSADESRLADYQQARALLEEIRQPVPEYVDIARATLEDVRQIIGEIERELDATKTAREIWNKQIVPMIGDDLYLRRDYEGALKIIEENVPETERQSLRERLFSEWRKALEEQLNAVLSTQS